MGMLFHEGLHGFTGMTDPQLQQALGCTVTPPPLVNSLNITDYVKQFLSIPQIVPGNIRDCSYF
jgi:hypothetical protein